MMEDKVVICVILALLAFMPQSCMIRLSNKSLIEHSIVGSGTMTEIDVKDPGDFNEIILSLPMDIEYSYGEPSVLITCDENAAEYIEIKCSDNKLELGMSKEKAAIAQCEIRAKISSPSLQNLTIAGIGSFVANGIDEDEFVVTIAGNGDCDISGLKAADLKLTIAGSGDIDLDGVNARNVTGNIAGSGDISIAGKAEKATFSIAGSGEVETDHLECPMMEFK